VKQAYLDRDNFGIVYQFIKKPVWFTIEISADEDLLKAWPVMTERFSKVNGYLDSLFEAGRAGSTPPEMPEDVKEIIAQCLAPAAAAPAKKQKPKDTAAASSLESQSS